MKTTTTAGESWAPIRESRSPRRPTATTWPASPMSAAWAARISTTNLRCGRHGRISKSRSATRISRSAPAAARNLPSPLTRKDEFDGEIQLDFADLPPGFHVTTPLTIEAGQTAAYGTITADADAPAPTPENSKLAKVAASAMVDGKKVKKKAIELGEIKLARAAEVSCSSAAVARRTPQPPALLPAPMGKPTELAIAPGETISANAKGRAQRLRRGNQIRRRTRRPESAARRLCRQHRAQRRNAAQRRNRADDFHHRPQMGARANVGCFICGLKPKGSKRAGR